MCQPVQPTAPCAKSLPSSLEPLPSPENCLGRASLVELGFPLPHHPFTRRRHQRLRQGHKEREGVRREPPWARKLGGGGGGWGPTHLSGDAASHFPQKLRSQLLLQGRAHKETAGGRGRGVIGVLLT